MPLRYYLDRSLEFQRKSEDKDTNLKFISKWMLLKVTGLKEDTYVSEKRRGPFQNMEHITI